MDLTAFPRTRLCNLPTPLYALDGLTKELSGSQGGPRIFIKRDDLSGLAMGGNKARQLEFYLGEAIDQGADTVITTGAIQSNHACMTAAAAAKLGLACHIQLETRVPGKGPDYGRTGNPLLDRLFGATIHIFPEGEDEQAADDAIDAIADDVREQGGRPYTIHLGGDTKPLGALGYVDAAGELLHQAAEMGINIDAIVLPSGSGSTHCGLLAGLRAHGSPARVLGICIRRDAESQKARIIRRLEAVCTLIGQPGIATQDDVWLFDDYFGPGYGQSTPEMLEATALMARVEGILVDPVYTGKSLSGLIGLVRNGGIGADENVLFLHTGGLAAMFAYADMLSDL
ncbi:MAG: D-cysteine desulfhydrase family protein [Alphaproteobacteria bacterium]|jgi:L-cysteate sulfo-lyase|nr:D-cysteine desulfhydrase family protein [Alphaproteobacteria bacterium]MBT7942799.1 D-cysteine desulfhydrase family protein [Alphaproteobacteria bacterium]